jgi:uncharacterized protein (DUF1697 family)|tara:strand:- start:1638 stop:2174 length:537 start_codon:yes stop_codon:yes gene_type:complete
MPTHLSLLRGINVAGHRKLKMAELTALYEALGFTEVTSYLQSGNILFSSADTEAALAKRIETALQKTFGLDVSVRVFSKAEWLRLAANNPLTAQQGVDAQFLHLTVLFEEPKTAVEAIHLPLSDDEAGAYANNHYYLYCPHGYGRTKIHNSYFERTLKVVATTRNWKTVQALKDRLAS